MSDQRDHRDTVPTPGDHEQSSEADPDASDLELTRAEEAEIARTAALEVEGFEQGIQG